MIELHHIDCMEFMRGLPDKAFDLAIVDPPYGIGADEQVECFSPSKFGNRHRKGWAKKGWDDSPPPAEYFVEIKRVSCHQIIWGANYFLEHLPSSRGVLVWDKIQDFSGSDFELAWTSFDTAAKSFRMARVMAYRFDDKIHPTQKPVALYRWLLKNYAKPGQRILDTHLGSGSIAIACDIEGFDLVGCELDGDYIAAARKRLAEHQAQPRLFDTPKPSSEQLSLDAA